MEARERLDRLHLNDDRVIDDHVKAVAGVQTQPFILDWQGQLTANASPLSPSS